MISVLCCNMKLRKQAKMSDDSQLYILKAEDVQLKQQYKLPGMSAATRQSAF